MIGTSGPGFSFSEASIAQNAPPASGVYALYKKEVWVYVGESNDIQRRLFEHLRGDTPLVTKHGPTGFCFETFPAQSRVARQNQLIAQLSPVANQMFG